MPADRPRVLVVTEYFEPGRRSEQGRAVAETVRSLERVVDVYVVAGDRDWGDRDPYPLPCEEWLAHDGAKVRYHRWGRRTPGTLTRVATEVAPHVIYLPGIVAPGSVGILGLHSQRKLSAPIVVAPHRSRAAGGRGRRRVPLRIARRAKALAGVLWLVGSPEEASWIRDAVPDAEVVVGSELPRLSPPALPAEGPPDTGKRVGHARLVFLGGAITRRRLLFALNRMAESGGEIRLDVYGAAADAEQWRACRELLSSPPPNVRAVYHGRLQPRNPASVLSAADALVLPTMGEAHGYSIFTALAAGCPVLASDRTPWRDLQGRGCGWDLPLRQGERWVEAIDTLVAMDDAQRSAMGRAARDEAERHRRFVLPDSWLALFEGHTIDAFNVRCRS